MATGQDAINFARKYEGYREGPRNNETIFGKYCGVNFLPWCGSFVKYVLDHVGVTGEPSPVWTVGGVRGYRAAGRWNSRNSGKALAGDPVFFDFGGSEIAEKADHVGFFIRYLPGGKHIETIEGNTSSGSRGSQSNGGGVYVRQRSLGTVIGFGRPRYQAGQPAQVDWTALRRLVAAKVVSSCRELPDLDGSSAPSLYIVVLQQALNLASGANIAEDGIYGQATITAVLNFQTFMKNARCQMDDFPGAAHRFTRFWLCVALEKIRDGQ